MESGIIIKLGRVLVMIRDVALRARGLHFSFGDTAVLHDVDLDLPWGAVTAVAGPNGAGKSTLVEVLAGVLTPQRGTVDCGDDIALVVQRPAVPDSPARRPVHNKQDPRSRRSPPQTRYFSSCRAITTRRIWLVPS